MRHLFICIRIQSGEFEHTHKVLHTTNCKNLQFAVNWCIAHYWGQAEKVGVWWEWHPGLCGKLEYWKLVPDKDYEILNKYV